MPHEPAVHRRNHRLTWLVGVAVVVTTVVGSPHMASADEVDNAERNVEQTVAELERLRDQMGQIDEDYSGAQDRQAELEQEIAAAQAHINDLSQQLGGMQTVLTDLAVKHFTSGDSLQLSPIFSTALSYSEAEQVTALGLVAIDSGETDMDSMQAVFDQLSDEQVRQQNREDDLAGLIDTLETKRVEYTALEQEYTAKVAKAKADLGEAKLQAAEEARARAAAARAAQRARAATKSGSTPNGNSSGTGSPATGGTSSGGGSTGGANYPPPSSRAEIAVQAALSQLGVPYKFATANPGVSFDCSGLTGWAWKQAGVSLPHQSQRQYNVTSHVPLDQAMPGDLIFYYTPIGHVGIYIGGGRMVHSPEPGSVVNITTVHWNKVVGVGRPG